MWAEIGTLDLPQSVQQETFVRAVVTANHLIVSQHIRFNEKE